MPAGRARGAYFCSTPCATSWVPAAVHTILRWCSGSPTERVRFSWARRQGTNGRNETTFPGLRVSRFLDARSAKNCLITKYTHPLWLCAHLFGTKVSAPKCRNAQGNALYLRACSLVVRREPRWRPTQRSSQPITSPAQPQIKQTRTAGRSSQSSPHPRSGYPRSGSPRSGSNRWTPTGGLATAFCGLYREMRRTRGGERDILGILRLRLFWSARRQDNAASQFALCERWQLGKGVCRSWVELI